MARRSLDDDIKAECKEVRSAGVGRKWLRIVLSGHSDISVAHQSDCHIY
jgi:hypothetical protein